ncbi:ATP-binding protein [Nocardioides ochotonae]|uniref:ATP-binding protein n=1 Tax=Nocardioides ochotonae TaxID=2685869 RepID=UPI00140A6A6C
MPTTVLLLLVTAALLRVADLESRALALAAGALAVTVQLAALGPWWARWPPAARYALPLGHIVAVGLLDLGAGLELGLVDVLVLLPLLSLSLRPGSAGISVGLGASAVVLFMPVLMVPGRPYVWLQGGIAVLVVAYLAWVVHAIVEDERRQGQQLEQARTELAVQARELRASRDVLNSIVQAATEQAIVGMDRHGVVLTANSGAERILDRDAEELVGTSFTDLVDPAVLAQRVARDASSPLAVVLGAAASGGTGVSEWPVVLPDGSSRPLEIVVTPRPAIEPLPAGFVLVGTDVSARHEEQRLQDEFIGLVSHELRTPLSSILSYLELLRLDRAPLSEDQRGYLEVVERNAVRLRQLVDDLLLSAQLVHGLSWAPEELDVVEVVHAAVATQQPAARAAEVELRIAGDGEVPLVSDAQRLGQVVDNLLSNAVKHSPPGASVVVTIERVPGPDGGRAAAVRVRDEGSGIAADELARLTERFYRTRDTRRRRVRGVGLGLSLVKTIVDEHGGTLTIDSTPGAGTEVRVVVPDLPQAGD